MMEMIVAISVLALALIPLAHGFASQFREMKRGYYKSVAEQVLDGHREILARGEWRKHPVGRSIYVIKNTAFESLPDGETTLDVARNGDRVTLTLIWTSPRVGTVVKRGEFTP